jgi:hypothetical protein
VLKTEDEYAAGGHGGRQVRALYSYDAQGDDELTFEEGAMITIIEEADASGWARYVQRFALPLDMSQGRRA